jgi:hypothetical protein
MQQMFFYCRSYCLLNMFRAPLCPSSGARAYYTVGCRLWSLVLGFTSCRYGVELRVVWPVCGLQPELLMMGIMVPEKCWTNNKICNKKHLLHLVGILFPHINFKFNWSILLDDCRFLIFHLPLSFYICILTITM